MSWRSILISGTGDHVLICINHWGEHVKHMGAISFYPDLGGIVVHINHRDCAKGCHYKCKSYFNNVKCSFKSFLSNLEMFILNLVNKPAVTMMVAKIIYFAQSQKDIVLFFAGNFTALSLSFRSAVHLELICIWWYTEVRVPIFSVCNEISYESSTIFWGHLSLHQVTLCICKSVSKHSILLHSSIYLILYHHHAILTLVTL